MAKCWTNAITGLNGKNDPFQCDLVNLGDSIISSGGKRWRKAYIFHGMGSRSSIVVDASRLFLDRKCTVPLLVVASI